MLKSIIRTLLQKFIDDIDSDNCNITMEQQSKIISVLSNIANPDQRMSKIQACDYLGVSRATFDNYVRDGFIPKGIKQEGFKELIQQNAGEMEVRTILAVLSSLEPFRNMAGKILLMKFSMRI